MSYCHLKDSKEHSNTCEEIKDGKNTDTKEQALLKEHVEVLECQKKGLKGIGQKLLEESAQTLKSLMDWYEQQMKINKDKFEKEKTALLTEFNDIPKHLAGKMQSQFLLDKQIE